MKDSYKPWLLRDKGKENGCIATYEHDGPYLWGVGANDKRGIRPALYIYIYIYIKKIFYKLKYNT